MKAEGNAALDLFAAVIAIFVLIAMLTLGLTMFKAVNFDNRRSEYLEQAVSKQLTDKNCKHTGYGPGRSYDKVYLCNDGTYKKDSYKLVKLDAK